MHRAPLIVAGVALAAVPAVWGLVGNSSFSQTVPVQVPPQAQVAEVTVRAADGAPTAKPAKSDDNGDRHAAADDNRSRVTRSRDEGGRDGANAAGTAPRRLPAAAQTTTRSSGVSRHPEPGDDSRQAVAPSDNRGRQPKPGTDNSGRGSTSSSVAASTPTSGTSGHGSGSGRRGGESGGGRDDGAGHQ
jgi:hypothetical protein